MTTSKQKIRKASGDSGKPAISSTSARGGAKRPAKSTAASRAPVTAKPAQGITNYTTAIKWLREHTDYERMRMVPYNTKAFSLHRVKQYLAQLGNPHQELACVHVAGTKGKGSTCAMVSSMLRSCGYTVGLYSSPHLIDLRERVTIDGQMISHADMADLFKQIAKIEQSTGQQGLTFYEILTIAALRYFADQAVDVAVLETGLGGRLDATNVVTPLVCGITGISLDHTNVLGKDLASITKEKAGIFKKGVAAVSVSQEPEVIAVLDEVAEAADTPLEYTGKQINFSYRFEATRELGPHTRVCVTTETSKWEHLPVPLRGEHQALNCGLALAMLDKLKQHGFELADDRVIAGLADTHLPGRMEQVCDSPRVLVDGAHNAASIHALFRALGAHIPYDSLVLIFGCSQDKDVDSILKQVSLGADKVVFTQAKGAHRAVEPKELITRFAEQSSKMAQSTETLEDALKLAARAVSKEDLVVVTGSFYLAGEAKRFFADRPAGQRA